MAEEHKPVPEHLATDLEGQRQDSIVSQLSFDRPKSTDDASSHEAHESSGEAYEETKPEDPPIGTPVVKTKSRVSVNDISAVPNGGAIAWLQVLGGFFILFNSWGVANTFGAYQTYYESPSSIFSESSSNISWIGSIQSFLLLFVGALVGPIYDAGHFRALLIGGSLLVVFGHMMLSLCNAYWQAVLAQGIVVGVGCGCMFVPGVAVIATYFTTRLPIAQGVVAAGSSIGGVIYPIVFHRLQPRIGFGWTVRVIGFVILATQLISCSAMKMRVRPAAKRPLLDLPALREPPYMMYIAGQALGFAGLYVPFYYLSYYTQAHGYASENVSFYVLTVINAGSIFGRIIPNLAAQSIGPMNTLFVGALCSGVLMPVIIGVKNLAGVFVIGALYGFFSGCFVSLPPTILVHLTPNRAMIGTRMGMGFTVMAFGVLVGTPIAGAILGPAGQENWTGVWVFGGCVVLASAAMIAAARVLRGGWKLKKFL